MQELEKKDKDKEKKKPLPKWKQGFNIVYSADEHCAAHRAPYNPAKKPELSIRSAVLANALGDFALGEGKAYVEALSWLKGASKSMPGYSFIDICDAFGISSDAARESILKETHGRARLKNIVGRYN